MSRSGKSTFQRSSGFTLVEMLVVVSIIVMLAAITVAFMPRFAERQRAAQGADLLQQWLLTAREWAKRDRVPTGIRLQPGRSSPTNPNAVSWITDMQYIQQPEPFVVTGLIDATTGQPRIRKLGLLRDSNPQPPPIPPRYDLADLEPATSPPTPDFTGGQNIAELRPVQIGDWLELKGGGLLHQIIDVQKTWLQINRNGAPVGQTGTSIGQIPFTEQYRIIRTPRIVAGEQTLQVPQGVAIDLTPIPGSSTAGAGRSPPFIIPSSSAAPQSYDILFAPSGSIILPQAADKIVLWVRDVTQDSNASNSDTLVTIYSRSGSIAAHPPDSANNYTDPFTYTRDGRSSGL